MSRALIIDDDKNYVSALSEVVKRNGFAVDTLDRFSAGQAEIERNRHEIVFVDMILPDGNGMDIIRDAPAAFSGKFYVMTGYPSVDTAISALTGRAVDYLVKPVTTKKIENLLTRFMENRAREKARPATVANMSLGGSVAPSPQIFTPGPTQQIIGSSAPIRKMLHDIHRLAVTNVSVLIQGESGTGKELVAHRIHALSSREGELHAVNCGTISGEQIASELFGHEKGSFPGANKARTGLLERARGGTLFLDEITEMNNDMQVCLLRVLESGKFSKLGSSKELNMDVRILAATNADPIEAIRKGKLREDLYFRLAEMPVIVPPLRNRGKDILVLAEHFLDMLNEQYEQNKRLEDAGKVTLMKYQWPGNVRELSHAIHQAYIVSDETLDLSNIPDMMDHGIAQTPGSRYLGKTIAEMEKELILETLAHLENDKPRTAELLGISLKTLYNRLNRYNRPQHTRMVRPSE